MGRATISDFAGATVAWDVVEESAKLAFSVWMGHPELIWAKEQWNTPPSFAHRFTMPNAMPMHHMACLSTVARAYFRVAVMALQTNNI
jgi:hypothetical protein